MASGPIDWTDLRARLPKRMVDVALGKFTRADEDTYLTGTWRLDGRPVRVHLECDPREWDFEAAAVQARAVRARLADYVSTAQYFAAAHLMGLESFEPNAAAAHLYPGVFWFYGDDTWTLTLKDGEPQGLSGLAWGNSIVVQFTRDRPTQANIED